MVKDSPRILYIEDNPLNMILVRKSLHFMGYRLLEAANGMQGINMAMRYLPDLVLMDLNLPDMSGTRVAKILRQNPATRHVAIVALTADSVDDPAAWCRDNGFDAYLVKPITRTVLLQTVQYWSEQVHQRLGQEQAHEPPEDAQDASNLEDTKPGISHLHSPVRHHVSVWAE